MGNHKSIADRQGHPYLRNPWPSAELSCAFPLGHMFALVRQRDLATIGEAAAKVEPYIRADSTRIWALGQLERQLEPEAYGRGRAATSTVDRPATDS